MFLAIRESLSQSTGLLNISNSSLEAAVLERYLSSDTIKTIVHQELMFFFSDAPSDVVSNRRMCSELPYHMLESNSIDSLRRFCLNIKHFSDMRSSSTISPMKE